MIVAPFGIKGEVKADVADRFPGPSGKPQARFSWGGKTSSPGRTLSGAFVFTRGRRCFTFAECARSQRRRGPARLVRPDSPGEATPLPAGRLLLPPDHRPGRVRPRWRQPWGKVSAVMTTPSNDVYVVDGEPRAGSAARHPRTWAPGRRLGSLERRASAVLSTAHVCLCNDTIAEYDSLPEVAHAERNPAPCLTLRSRAPIRLDLAGGWTDVAPFSTEEGGAVVNAAINRYSYTTLRLTGSDTVRLISADYDLSLTLPGQRQPPLRWQARPAEGSHQPARPAPGHRALRAQRRPARLGTGSSAATSIAILGVLNAVRPQPLSLHQLAELATCSR